MPSLQEGFGIVLLEAMAAGLPIVAFDLPVYREFMDDRCAIFVPKLDVVGMAEAIGQLLADEKCRQQMATYNQRRAQQFTWASVAQRKEQVLLEIALSAFPRAGKIQ
jgi:glycosyltransferase involved in cell wall biosynthesis